MKHFLIIALFCITFVGLHAESTKTPYHFGGAFNDIDVEEDYAYVASDAGLKIFDVSNPTDLRLIGTYDTNVSVKKLVVDSDRVYLGTEKGVEIIDIQSPSEPQLLGTYLDSPSSYYVRKLAVKDSYLYRETSNGISRLDMHDISHISENDLDSASLLGLSSNYVFIQISPNDNTIKAIDTSDPSLPSYDLVLDTNNSFHMEKGIIEENTLYAYGWRGDFFNKVIDIYDISSPLSPQKTATYMTHNSHAPELFLYGKKLFLKSYGYSIEIVDVSDPSNPTYITTQQIDREYNDLKGLSFHNDTLFVVTKRELASINIADLNSFEYLDTYRTLTSAYKIILHDKELYVADSAWGIVKLDISNPNNIKYFEYISTSNPHTFIQDMKMRIDNIYVLGADLEVIDTSNPERMEKVYQQISANEKMIITDSMLYTAGYFGLNIYDLSTTISPLLLKGVKYYHPDGNVYNLISLATKDKWMYAISSTDYSSMQLLVFNLADPENPELVKSYDLIDQYGKLTLYDDTLFLYSGNNNKFQMVDVSDSASPIMLETYPAHNFSDISSGLVLHGHYAYLSKDYTASIEVVDMTRSDSPMFVKNIDLAHKAQDLAIDDKHLFIADGTGVTVLPLDDTDNDGTADAIDDDNDNDGIKDINDAFPHDPHEWADTDHDSIGDNADADDDNDGIDDQAEIAAGLDPHDPRDAHKDSDGDGFDNAIELSLSTDMRDIHDTPIWVGLTMADGIVITIPAKQGQ